ncbi:DUF4870 domain-containing protein [Aquimarina sp. ERC-38]|uniref:DUF4870 domain-containing protein n=1 Tax=Aquimarina sp. ERC-38 TaxID=2949996 RepID=UPI0022482343|nr:DUF4870 domain-containing protein [Aquimarina sp. ERC-38]UZO80352.1 DUF4870 domain-containing protein [Aquimarina sp. ERC-38]
MDTTHYQNIATFLHLSTFSKYFIPLGNFIVPIVIWIMNRDKSNFIDKNGKAVINFQLSILIYTIVLGMISIPFFVFNLFDHSEALFDFDNWNHFNIHIPDFVGFQTLIGFSIIGLVAAAGFFIEIILILTASIKANKGEAYEYPFTIRFFK